MIIIGLILSFIFGELLMLLIFCIIAMAKEKKAERHEEFDPVFIEDTKSALDAQWINYKEEKPPFGVEVIAYHHKWINEDFNPNGTRVGFLGDDGFISAFWWDYQDCYETISKPNCESNKDFYRSHIDNTEPEFWFPIPKFIKE